MDDKTKELFLKLKEKHRGSAKDTREQIYSWESDYEDLEVEKDWLAHPKTQELKQAIQEAVKGLDMRLCNEETMTEQERMRLFGNKKALEGILSKLDQPIDDMLKSIIEKVKYEL